MKKTILMLLAAIMLLSLAACRTEEEIVVVPSDAERMVELAMAPSAAESADTAPQAPEIEMAEEHYDFSTTAAEGRLTVEADAPVRYPASLRLPIARVSAVGFTQELASKAFAYFFTGEQPIVVESYGAAKITKQQLRDTIALYESYIVAGTSETMTLLDDDELREEIERLEAQIPNAPETASPDVVSDGTMLPGVWDDNGNIEQTLELNVNIERANLFIATPVEADEHSQGFFSYNAGYKFSDQGMTATEIAEHSSIDGMNTTWDEAMGLCDSFFEMVGLKDVALGKAYQVECDNNIGYQFDFVRTVAGIPIALNYETTAYKGTNTPWSYEIISITIDDEGFSSIGWASPTKMTEIVNAAATAMPFAQAAEIFETMVVETYESKTTFEGHEREIDVRVDRVELSLLRIRDVGTDERTGLYVPAWLFYGMSSTNGHPDKKGSDHIVFAVNAIDGSVIDMQKGY